MYGWMDAAVKVHVIGNMTNETKMGKNHLCMYTQPDRSYCPRLNCLLSVGLNGTLPCDLPIQPHHPTYKPDQNNNYLDKCVVVCPKQHYALREDHNLFICLTKPFNISIRFTRAKKLE
jgi:hypothetical protein